MVGTAVYDDALLITKYYISYMSVCRCVVDWRLLVFGTVGKIVRADGGIKYFICPCHYGWWVSNNFCFQVGSYLFTRCIPCKKDNNYIYIYQWKSLKEHLYGK